MAQLIDLNTVSKKKFFKPVQARTGLNGVLKVAVLPEGKNRGKTGKARIYKVLIEKGEVNGEKNWR